MPKHERAFAIQAPPDTIWRLLRAEIRSGVEAGRAEITHEEQPRQIVVGVRLGWGLGVRYDYRLAVRADHTEVAVEVAPHGFRHALANIVSLGRASTPYLLAVTQGLANLKEAAEGEIHETHEGKPS